MVIVSVKAIPFKMPYSFTQASRIVLVISLPGTHDPFMGHSAYRCHVPFLCQIDIGGTNAGGVLIILIVTHQLLYCQFLCLCRETASQTEFTVSQKSMR